MLLAVVGPTDGGGGLEHPPVLLLTANGEGVSWVVVVGVGVGVVVGVGVGVGDPVGVGVAVSVGVGDALSLPWGDGVGVRRQFGCAVPARGCLRLPA